MIKKLEVEIKDTVFNPLTSEKKVYKKIIGELPRYKVWLFLEGKDLPYVKNVIYKLHHTFKRPERIIDRTPSNPNCSLIIWTWGIFIVKALIYDKSGQKHEIEHKLIYGEQLIKKDYKVIKT